MYLKNIAAKKLMAFLKHRKKTPPPSVLKGFLKDVDRRTGNRDLAGIYFCAAKHALVAYWHMCVKAGIVIKLPNGTLGNYQAYEMEIWWLLGILTCPHFSWPILVKKLY